MCSNTLPVSSTACVRHCYQAPLLVFVTDSFTSYHSLLDQNAGGVPGENFDTVLSQTVYCECFVRSALTVTLHTYASQVLPLVLCLLAVYEGYAVVFRKYVSRKAAGKGRAVLEGLGLAPEMVEACFVNNPLNEEAAVQDGLNKWREGHHGHSPTWKVLVDAMVYAGVAVQHIEGLKVAIYQKLIGTCLC